MSCAYEDAKGRKIKWRPLIKIWVLHPSSTGAAIFFHPEPIRALVDTGSPFTIFTQDVANIFNIDLRRYKTATFLSPYNDKTVCVGGLHSVDLYICGKKIENVPAVFPLERGEDYDKYLEKYDRADLQREYPFSKYSPNMNLLGTYGFLDKVLISLDSEHMYLFRMKTINNSRSEVVKTLLRAFWNAMLNVYARLRMRVSTKQ